jgi:hypothetical protein
MCGGYEPEYNPDEEEFVSHFPLTYKNLFYPILNPKEFVVLFSSNL